MVSRAETFAPSAPSERRGLLALATAASIWGLVPVAVRGLALTTDAGDLLVVRLGLTVIALAPFAVLPVVRRRISGHDAIRLGLLGILATYGYLVLVTVVAAWLPAAPLALLIATESPFIAVVGSIADRTRLPVSAVLASALGLTGVVAIVGLPGAGSHPLFGLGVVLGLVSSIAWAIFTIASRRYVRSYGPMTVTAISTCLSGLPFLLALRPEAVGRVATSTDAGLALALLVVGSGVIGTPLWAYGVVRVPPARSGPFMFLVPAVASALDVVVLREPLSLGVIIGGALILGSIALSLVRVERSEGVAENGAR